MLRIVEDSAHVIMAEASGHISDEDIAAAIEAMDHSLAAGGELHKFAEVKNLSGVDPSGLVHGLLNGAHLLNHLRRFGRVGIVSEQRWVRVLSRVESALLPGISYRVYEPGQREAALDWVRGCSPN